MHFVETDKSPVGINQIHFFLIKATKTGKGGGAAMPNACSAVTKSITWGQRHINPSPKANRKNVVV